MKSVQSILSRPGAKVHLIGIGGSGVSGLAHLLLDRGIPVSGSDAVASEVVEHLRKRGAQVEIGQSADHLRDAELVVFSSAVRPENPERESARRRGIPEVRRATLLAALMQGRRSWVVAGAHGKTTTSAMLAHVLRHAGRLPSHYVGAEVPVLGECASAGSGEDFVAEGDESDGSLLELPVQCGIALNIEPEHLDYFKDFDGVLAFFREWHSRCRERVFWCEDDPGCVTVFGGARGGRTVSFGFSSLAQYRCEILREEGLQTDFLVHRRGESLGPFRLNIPGRQNASNATAVVAAAEYAGIPAGAIIEALGTFRGARRRFDIQYRDPEYLVIDDYAHHPTEIRATLAAARKAVGAGRLLAVFQPHRYSRTEALAEEFGGAFDSADAVWVDDVYAAGEIARPGITGKLVADAAVRRGHPAVAYVPGLLPLEREVSKALRPNDVVVVLGAGSVRRVAEGLAVRLKRFRDIASLLKSGGRLLREEPMQRHTTFRIGGAAELWCEPEEDQDAARVVRYCHEQGVPLAVIGRGSNLLVRDGGIRGVCLHLASRHHTAIEVHGQEIHAGAGARLKAIVAAARKAGLGGLEFMEGIPGNLGGALRMNAGAMGGWTWERVVRVKTLARDGVIRDENREDFEVRYRAVPALEEKVALGAVLRCEPLAEAVIAARLKEFSAKRWASQPAAPSAGCIFKNPEGGAAGQILDASGLKNVRQGGARISEVHANFIVNDGGATASDVLKLIEKAQLQVKEKRRIKLETEVIVLGEE
jgi:UDP-N-acetylmuramate--L-alanine ligase/UDP-N-acetylenolpyruvoylglucosamine reductase